MIRFSVGIEATKDIIMDLEQALNVVEENHPGASGQAHILSTFQRGKMSILGTAGQYLTRVRSMTRVSLSGNFIMRTAGQGCLGSQDVSFAKAIPGCHFPADTLRIVQSLGVYLVFQGLDQLNQASQLQSASAIGSGARIAVGGAFCVLAVLRLASSLGMFLSRNDREAARHLRWLGKWRPRS